MPFPTEFFRTFGKNIDLVVGGFKPNGTGVIDNTLNFSLNGTNAAAGFTVVRSPTGIYTVTLTQEYPGLAALITFEYNLGAFEIEPTSVPGPLTNGKTFVLQGKDPATGVAADITAAANRFVGFAAFLKSKGGFT